MHEHNNQMEGHYYNIMIVSKNNMWQCNISKTCTNHTFTRRKLADAIERINMMLHKKIK